MNFYFEDTEIKGLKIVHPFYVEDERGFFLKSFEKEIFKTNGINTDIFESFISYSFRDVVRGMHFQTKNPQAKLVGVIQGEILDVAVDLRMGSTTFGQWFGLYLSSNNRKQLFIPKGFAHGFIVKSNSAVVMYQCEGAYSSESDSGIVWKDKDLAINWDKKDINQVIVSEKDSKLQSFRQFIDKYKGLEVTN